MSLIYGYSESDKNSEKNNNPNVSNLEKLVGKKTDDRTADTAFGKIQDNKKNIQTKSTLLGSKADSRSVDTAFGRIKGNKRDLQTSRNLVGTASSLEGESNLKGTQLSHASAIMAHSGNLLNLEDAVGKKSDSSSTNTAFGRIKKNTDLVGSSTSLEGEPNLKGTQLSHASAIAAHAGNLLVVEDALGTKSDSDALDTAFGRIKNLEKLGHAIELQETTGTFVAPTNDGKVEITGWTMPRSSTIIAIIIKAKQTLVGVHWATLHSGTSMANNSYMIVSLMTLANMKLGSPAILLNTRDPGHARIYASTKGNAKGSVSDRTIEVKFIFIDHS